MAIDSALKRKSIAAIGLRVNGPTVVPDSTIDGADRQVIGYSFSGIPAGAGGGGAVLSTVFKSIVVSATGRPYG